eukprot:jgi/Mesen1/7432/ME000388S06643
MQRRWYHVRPLLPEGVRLFEGTRQVCKNCASLASQRMSCPTASSGVCCSNDSCQKSVAGLACSSHNECPTRSCCQGDAYKRGYCAPVPVAGGKQVCKDCTGFPTQ